jgi:Flp pilus assembly protein TadG
MGSEFIIMPLFIAAVFGIFYLHYSTRNKEGWHL